MGIKLFIILAIIELIFAGYCITTKSNQKKVRSILHIVFLAVFIILTSISIINWSSKWYAIAMLLLAWAVIGAVTLIRNKPDKKEYSRRRIIVKAICMVFLAFFSFTPALVFPEYEMVETTGKFNVETALYTYTDTNRIETYTDIGESRKLTVEFWYPKEASGTYPLIIFSHGGLGIKTSNESLFNELASHGYIVCSIDHTYQCLYTTDVNGNKTRVDSGYTQELRKEDAKSNKQQSYEYYKKWMNIRTGDINFVIDHILSESSKTGSNTLYKFINREKIGVMGHSLGGSAALGIGRSRSDVKAVVALESPFLCDIHGVADNKFIFNNEPYPVPVLNIYSDSSWNHLSDWAQYAENNALLSDKNGYSFYAYIKGVGHFTLTDLALSSPFLTRVFNGKKSETDTEYCLKTINKLTLDFFNCYLNGEGKFKSAEMY